MPSPIACHQLVSERKVRGKSQTVRCRFGILVRFKNASSALQWFGFNSRVAVVFEFRSSGRNERYGHPFTHEKRRASAFHHKGFYNRLDQMFQSLRDSARVMAHCTGLEQTLDEKGATDYDVSRVVANQNVLLMN
jgi:hypothetical protein